MPVDLLFVLIIILVLVVMWRGPKTLPKLGEALGRGVRELKDTVREVDPRDDVRRTLEAPDDEARAAGSDRRDEPPST